MKTSTTIFNSLNPENVYDQVKGTFFIYSYLCPCRFCMHQYLNLSRKFIKIYYSEAYFETSLLKINDNKTIHYLLNNFKLCRGTIELMGKKLKQEFGGRYDRYKFSIKNYIYSDDNKQKVKFDLINESNNCLFQKYDGFNFFKYSKISITQVHLSSFIKEMYEKLERFKVDNKSIY